LKYDPPIYDVQVFFCLELLPFYVISHADHMFSNQLLYKMKTGLCAM